MWEPNTLELRAFCRRCGQIGEHHRASDGHCPGKGLHPKWPRSIRDEAKAGALYDKRMVKYWNERSTIFEAVK